MSPYYLPQLFQYCLEEAGNGNVNKIYREEKISIWNMNLPLRACSHEPGTVNYPGASDTSHSHDDLLSRCNVELGQLHCPRASSSTSDHYEFI